MQNSLLLITTILIVGTVSASAYAFYNEPDKTLALFGKPSQESITSNYGQVAGETATRIPESFPKHIPIFQPSVIVSTTKTMQSSQITLKTEESMLKVINFYKEILSFNEWERTSTDFSNGTQELLFKKNGQGLAIKVSAVPETKETIIFLSHTD